MTPLHESKSIDRRVFDSCAQTVLGKTTRQSISDSRVAWRHAAPRRAAPRCVALRCLRRNSATDGNRYATSRPYRRRRVASFGMRRRSSRRQPLYGRRTGTDDVIVWLPTILRTVYLVMAGVRGRGRRSVTNIGRPWTGVSHGIAEVATVYARWRDLLTERWRWTAVVCSSAANLDQGQIDSDAVVAP